MAVGLLVLLILVAVATAARRDPPGRQATRPLRDDVDGAYASATRSALHRATRLTDEDKAA